MKLKASVDYGVRAIMFLAVRGRVCSSREISDETAVPRDYLIQLALRLRNAGLVKTRPGKNGGYELAKPADKITIGQVVDAFDTDIQHARQPMRHGRPTAERATIRTAHGLFIKSLNSYLDAISVQDLIDATADKGTKDLIIADALQGEADRLRSRVDIP